MPDPTDLFPLCFVCGTDNPTGLHVPFSRGSAGESRAEYVAREEHVGWPELIHGGVLFTLLDEAVAWAVMYSGFRGVTAKAEVRFRAPARVGMRLGIKGWVTAATPRAVRARAEIRDGGDTGPIIADMEAMMAVTKGAGPVSDSTRPE